MSVAGKFRFFSDYQRSDATVRVTITSPDGAILRAYLVTLPEDTEHKAAIALGEMIGDFVGTDRNLLSRCKDITNAVAFAASVDETDPPETERYDDEALR
jgi:hypothetical protein